MTWIRTAGRADYAGWKLHIFGDQAELIVGHPLAECVFWWALWRLGGLKHGPIAGNIRLVQIVSPKRGSHD